MLNRLRKRLSARGFTLIELIVVMAVIAILVLLAAPKFLGYTQEAKITQAQHNAKVVENSMDEYLIKHDTLDASLVPVSNEDLNSIAQTGSLVDRNGVLTEVPEGTVFYKVPNDYVNGDLNIKKPAKDDVYITEDSYVVIDIRKSGAASVGGGSVEAPDSFYVATLGDFEDYEYWTSDGGGATYRYIGSSEKVDLNAVYPELPYGFSFESSNVGAVIFDGVLSYADGMFQYTTNTELDLSGMNFVFEQLVDIDGTMTLVPVSSRAYADMFSGSAVQTVYVKTQVVADYFTAKFSGINFIVK